MLDKLLFEEEVRLGVGGMVAVRVRVGLFCG